jgi:hypothetical protein
MLLATAQPVMLTENEQPLWVQEWFAAHAARLLKAEARTAEKESKPVDEKAAAKRKAIKHDRITEGVELLQQAVIDLTREGLANRSVRDREMWRNLAKRMVDCQLPGLAGALRNLEEVVLDDPEVDRELPFELARMYLLLKTFSSEREQSESLRAEVSQQIGIRMAHDARGEEVNDAWFVAARTVTERERLITSSIWLLGQTSQRWARVLRYSPAMQAMVDPWPVGTKVQATLTFSPGLYPLRAVAESDGQITLGNMPAVTDRLLDSLLLRFAAALAANPFLRVLPFIAPLRPDASLQSLVDAAGHALPWSADADLAFRVECLCAGHFVPVCGEWDGRSLKLLSISDGDVWHPLTRQHP